MREIKFRAWDGESMWIQGSPYIETIYSFFFHVDAEWALMQYTGLKDKNDMEIYDGDILNTETDKNLVVCWVDRFASFCLEKNGWAFRHFFGEAVEAKDCEIIGNIYENPELLTHSR